MNELITKYTRFLRKDDGSEVRIIAEAFYGRGLHQSIDVMVHRRESSEHDWKLCNDRPHPDWLKMSVDDYVKFGRSEMLQVVSLGQIMKTVSMIGQKMPVAIQ